MAVTWGSIVGGYGRIGIDVSISNSNTTSTVTFKVLFWSKYSVSDTSNTLYFDWNKSTATTSRGSKSISTTSDSGGWNTINQKLLYTTSTSYTRGTSDQTKYCAAKLTGVERVGGTMTHSRSFVIPKKPSYTVSYNANGGSGAPGKQTKWYGTNLTLSSTKPTRTGYTFQGWGTSSGDTTVNYAAGATYSANAAITLYAIWKIITYTVSYNANGGSGAPGSQTKNYGATLKLSTTKPTRTNYNFKGWATSSNGSVAYASGANYTANASVTLYAVWELAYWVPKITNLKVSRCNSDGSANEAGTYYSLSFNWECCQITGTNPVKSITHKLGSGTAQAISVSTSSTSGSVSIVSGNGVADVDTTYTIQVTITDKLNGSYTASVTLAATRFPIDFKAGGKGVAIGKPAELDDYLDVYFKSRFRNEVYLDQVSQIWGIDSSTGELVQALQPLSEAGNTVIGFGGYARKSGTTNIYGNDIMFYSAAAAGGKRPYWRKGDSWGCHIMTSGFVSNNKTNVWFTIPLDRPVLGRVNTVVLTSSPGLMIRQNNKYCYGSSSTKFVSPSSYMAWLDEGFIRVEAIFKITTNVSTNNDSMGVEWEGTITLT